MTSYRLGGALLAASVLLTTVLAGTATASNTNDTNGTADHSRSTLTLGVDGSRGEYGTVRLRCHPMGGSHPNPWQACRDLGMAGGDFDSLPGSPENIACTMEYRPVMATANGEWHGKPVRWQHQYPNPCTLLSATGVVFDF
jgi:hypothetical protein